VSMPTVSRRDVGQALRNKRDIATDPFCPYKQREIKSVSATYRLIDAVCY